jgi:hypothetical protein
MPLPRRSLVSPLLALASCGFLAACVRPAEQTVPENTPAPRVEAFADAPPPPAQAPTVAGIPAAAIAAAERAQARVETASTATTEQGAIYRQAQALHAEGKHAEALAALDRLQTELFTPAQEKAVTELRAKILAAQSGS